MTEHITEHIADLNETMSHVWEYHGAIRECSKCKLRETYWDDEEYPVDPCPEIDYETDDDA